MSAITEIMHVKHFERLKGKCKVIIITNTVTIDIKVSADHLEGS